MSDTTKETEIANAAMLKLAEETGDSTFADFKPFQIAYCSPFAYVKILHRELNKVFTVEINVDELNAQNEQEMTDFDRYEAAQLDRLDAMRQGDFDERPFWT
jgi:hypothetical protein